MSSNLAGVLAALDAEHAHVTPTPGPPDEGRPCSHWGCPRTDGDPCGFHAGRETTRASRRLGRGAGPGVSP